MKISAGTYAMALCTARFNAAIMVGYFAPVKTNVEAHEIIQKCILVSLFNP